jgi:two-component system NarL family response regulator
MDLDDDTAHSAHQYVKQVSEQTVEQFIGTARIAISIKDTQRRYLFANPVLGSIIGCNSQNIIGQVAYTLMPPAMAAVIRALDQRVLDTGAPIESEVTLTHEGATRSYYFKHLPLTNDAGQIAAIGAIAVDMTEHKQAQDAIQKQQEISMILRERERLARDIDTIIGDVLSQVNKQAHLASETLLAGDTAQTRGQLADLQSVIQEAQNRVQGFALGISIDDEIDPDFAALYHERGFFAALREYVRRFSERFTLEVETSIPPHLLHEDFPTTVQIQLLHIAQESLTAARHYANARHVWLAFDLRERMLQLTITDDGQRSAPLPDIPNAARRITDQDYALRRLGERVRDIGGMLDVRTAPHEPGIVVSIPLRRQGDLPVQSLRVLLASPQAEPTRLLQTLLETHGLRVAGVAQTGSEAEEQTRALRPDIVLLDTALPPHGAPDVVRQIKAQHPDLKAVIFTDDATDDELFAAIRSGAVGYLPLNLPPENLLELLLGLQRGEVALLPEMAQKVLEAFAHTNEHPDEQAPPSAAPESLSSLLSPRQMEVLWLVAQDYTYREVGEILGFSERTIKHYMSGIIKQLQLQSRAEAVALVRQRMNQPPPESS